MTGTAAGIVALLLLAAALGVAVARPAGVNEFVVAGPAAALIVVLGIVPAPAARTTLRDLFPTVAFLAAILVFGHLCADAGVFDYLGARASTASRGSAIRLLGLVVSLAAVVTATLTLDATVVLLSPVVLRTARRLQVPPRVHLYACTQLANAGSLLLPVSNLTNLLAFSASGLTFARFTGLMALPWIAACALEWLALRTFFRADLQVEAAPAGPVPRAPRFALIVLAATVLGFVLTTAVGVAPAWAALGGAVVLAAARWRGQDGRARAATPFALLRAANLGFCGFVLALGILVDGLTRHGLGSALGRVLPSGTALPALLGLAFGAALLANVVNNLPATLALVPLVAGHPAAVLAVLIGVNVGPNATYAGSLATLLWRRLLPVAYRPRAVVFHAYGLATVPVIIVITTVLLWVSVGLLGA